MAEPKLKYYIGDITDGGTDGDVCKALQCNFPYTRYRYQVPIKIALRCDSGYKAENVNLTFTCVGESGLSVGYIYNYYYNPFDVSYSYDIGTVTDVNRIVLLCSGLVNGYVLTAHASYTEVKV